MFYDLLEQLVLKKVVELIIFNYSNYSKHSLQSFYS